MKASEIRVGNYVKISGILTTIVARDFDRYCKNDLMSGVEPIPLTREWLLKLGFGMLVGKIHYYDRFKLYFVSKYEFWYLNDKRTNTYITKVSSVHELQNAIFVLNGEEITIK